MRRTIAEITQLELVANLGDMVRLFGGLATSPGRRAEPGVRYDQSAAD